MVLILHNTDLEYGVKVLVNMVDILVQILIVAIHTLSIQNLSVQDIVIPRQYMVSLDHKIIMVMVDTLKEGFTVFMVE